MIWRSAFPECVQGWSMQREAELKVNPARSQKMQPLFRSLLYAIVFKVESVLVAKKRKISLFLPKC